MTLRYLWREWSSSSLLRTSRVPAANGRLVIVYQIISAIPKWGCGEPIKIFFLLQFRPYLIIYDAFMAIAINYQQHKSCKWSFVNFITYQCGSKSTSLTATTLLSVSLEYVKYGGALHSAKRGMKGTTPGAILQYRVPSGAIQKNISFTVGDEVTSRQRNSCKNDTEQ